MIFLATTGRSCYRGQTKKTHTRKKQKGPKPNGYGETSTVISWSWSTQPDVVCRVHMCSTRSRCERQVSLLFGFDVNPCYALLSGPSPA